MGTPQRPAVPRVAVVVVTYNSAEVLADCLTGLHDQAVTLTQVLVVDNGSADKSREIATAAQPRSGEGRAASSAAAPRGTAADLPVRVIPMGRNGGYAAAINAGIAAIDLSTVDAVMVLNPDCRLAPGCLGVLAHALRQPGVGIAVPLMLNPDGSLQPSIRNAPALRRAFAEAVLGRLATRIGGPGGLGELVTDPRPHARPGRVAWATGAAMLLSRQTIERVGAWDESFLLYSEETDYCLRAADAGLATWHEPTAVVEHIGGDQHTSALLAKLAVVNRVRLFRRRHNAVHAAAFFAVVAAGEGVRALFGRSVSGASFVALVRPSRRVRELPTPSVHRG